VRAQVRHTTLEKTMEQARTEAVTSRARNGSPADKYLTFALGDEEYGVPVLKVREIIKMMDITAVPQVPPHVKGVINLRGKVIPVVDLRVRFAFPRQDYTERTCIVVVDVCLSGRTLLMGVVVDAVSEVLSISAEQIQPTPEFGGQISADYMSGMAKVKDAVKILLNLDLVLGADIPGQPAAAAGSDGHAWS
jgi:purine-binding chemotaxis protein CheW